MNILILNGPNLNLLGIREPEIYGKSTYSDLARYISDRCDRLHVQYELYQSNHEGELVDRIQQAYGKADGIVINPAAYTHTSVAIPDALRAVAIPAVEVHLTDPKTREDFRRRSYTEAVCLKTFAGFGFDGYGMALEYLYDHLKNRGV